MGGGLAKDLARLINEHDEERAGGDYKVFHDDLIATYACNDSCDKDSWIKQDVSPADIKSAGELRDRLAKLPYSGVWGIGNSDLWRRPDFNEVAGKLAAIIAESNRPIIKASGLIATLPHRTKKDKGKTREDAFHFKADWETQDKMARAHKEMAVLIHFFRNMEHCRALQNYRLLMEASSSSSAGRKSKAEKELEKDADSMFSESSEILEATRYVSMSSDKPDAQRLDLQKEADQIVSETLKRNATS